MEMFFRVTIFIAGIINFIPSFSAFFPEKFSKLYGVDISDINYELLLRHRAVLFGIIGGLMIYSAISKKLYLVSSIAGLVSMISFITLYFLLFEGLNNEFDNIILLDVAATLILIAGLTVYYFSYKF